MYAPHKLPLLSPSDPKRHQQQKTEIENLKSRLGEWYVTPKARKKDKDGVDWERELILLWMK